MISIILPYMRPEGMQRCVEALGDLGQYPWPVELIREHDPVGIGVTHMVSRLVEKTSYDLVLFLADDTIPQPGMIEEAVKAMESLPDRWGLVALNDGHSNGAFAAHFLAHKKLIPHLGCSFFSTDYRHCFCDIELSDISKALGRYVYAEKAKFLHANPVLTGGMLDATYSGYKKEVWDADQHTYWRRKRARIGGRLAIGFPIVNPTVPTQFFLSVMAMNKPDEYTLLAPRFPTGGFHSSIVTVRNDLAEQALDHGCSHLLMMDTDQIYPADTLEKLASHCIDIAGVAVHRRYPPFDLILMRGEPGKYIHVPDEECYSGNLVDVDATGAGCLLIDTSVFIDMERPWFEFGKLDDGKTIGEDISFCAKARSIGKRIAVDTSIEVDHLTTFRVGRSTRKLYTKFQSL